jgi:hypothetical protein
MDQVKTYLAVLKKHHFWPLSVVIVLIGLYAWKSGAAHYDQLYAAGSSQLNSLFSDVNGVASNQPHPNQFFVAEVKNLNTQQLKDVKAAWQKLYDHQKQLLTWRQEYAAIGNLKPDAEIPHDLRENFWNYFKYEVPKLFDVISIREDPKAATAAAVKSGLGQTAPGSAPPDAKAEAAAPADEATPNGTVVWLQADRDKILNTYRWSQVPRTQQVRFAQEDYWVYQALLNIIKNTNGNVTDPRNVAIKKIEALDIAQAVPPPNRFAFPLPEGCVAGGEVAQTPPAKTGREGPTDEELANGRYVSADGTALPAPDATAQYKLMPIRMRFIMDQRRLPDLLVACANSPLPVEVQQVQFNASATESRA